MTKTIGIICPIGKDNSETRKRSDDIMNNIIVPIAKELGYVVQRADQMHGSVIMDDIIEMIRRADILVADLTENNPNVFYELGIRQAIKGKCINIVSDDWLSESENNKNLPFDINHFRAHKYKNTIEGAHAFASFIKHRIKKLEQEEFRPISKLNHEEIMKYYGMTVVTDYRKGEKNQYELAKTLFAEPCKTIFLMQRSSSLVLNAEQDWETESVFVTYLKQAMKKCNYFYHIISLDGIKAHFNRKNSVFPGFKNFTDNLDNEGGSVVLKVSDRPDAKFYLRKLPKDDQNSLFKLDRQARVLITETFSGQVNAVIVQNLGDNQTSFQITGSKAKEYLLTCREFYRKCELVYWKEIKDLYREYQEIEKLREKEGDE